MTTPTVDDITTRLTLFEQRLTSMIRPDVAVDEINQSLADLYDDGADPEALTGVQDQVFNLLQQARVLLETASATHEIARTIKDQRDQMIEDLAEMKRAIRQVDTSVPEIDLMYQEIEEMSMEWAFDVTMDNIEEEIAGNTPLSWEEAGTIVEAFINGELDADSPLWPELRTWLASAAQELRARYD